MEVIFYVCGCLGVPCFTGTLMLNVLLYIVSISLKHFKKCNNKIVERKKLCKVPCPQKDRVIVTLDVASVRKCYSSA